MPDDDDPQPMDGPDPEEVGDTHRSAELEPPLGAAFARLRQPGIYLADAVNADPRTLPPSAAVTVPGGTVPVPPLRYDVPMGDWSPGAHAEYGPPAQPQREGLNEVAGPPPGFPVRPPAATSASQVDGEGNRLRHVSLQSTGDEGIDAMLMCRSIFETLPDYERRRVLTYLADRYT